MNTENEIQADDQPETSEAAAQAEQDAMADAAREAEAEALEAEAEAELAGAPAPEPETPDLAAEVAELKDKLLRTMAEMENTRRIAAREKADASKYAVTNFARDIVRVADNLGMAMMMVTDEARQADKNLDNLCVGIDMTMKELLNIFESYGIKPVAAEGQPFDHNVHEAVQQVENTEVPKGTVMQVLRGGFTLQDRLLRPAQVIVSTGGPSAAEVANGGDENAPAPAEGAQQAYEPSAAEPGTNLDQET
ncbi:nucleotide exchange factor GrpE [Magnetovibrio sp.]|uniref:nucleotide exchange factor GrpE n=1 Tax=Magnetovibrio sp. TaxID=2024836 RepID=UPI002F938C8C